jgi:hypothetical protein
MWTIIDQRGDVRLLHTPRSNTYWIAAGRAFHALPPDTTAAEARRDLDQWARFARGDADPMPRFCAA